MIKHLFKLIWNKKKQNFLLITEIFVSFLVMFAVLTLLVSYYQNYNLSRGFEYENVWNVGYSNPEGMVDKDSIADFRASVKQLIRSMPQVEEVSFSDNNIPFGTSTISTSVSYNKKGGQSEVYTVDDSYKGVLKIHIKEGRWFGREDAVYNERPIVINETFKNNIMGGGNVLGKIIDNPGFATGNMKVIGVMEDMKDKGDYLKPGAGLFKRMDTGFAHDGTILIKVRPDADAAFESRLYKNLSNAIRNTSIDIKHMTRERITKNQVLLAPIITMLIIGGFLIINVALGLFGVLWYNINKRKSEIGLRRAVGASGSSISKQLVGEAMVLSTLSLLLGIFFAIQFPLLNVFNLESGTYLIAIGLDILFIYTLVLICSFYPGKQAAGIYPAVALHED
jgi:putative ABC transport system permease protein